MKRALLVAAALSLSSPARADLVHPTSTKAASRCVVDGVRALVADGGDSSIVEVSVRVSGSGSTDQCTIDWSRIALSSPEGAEAAPTIAVAQLFLDHALVKPVQVADGVASVVPRDFRGPDEKHVVAVRFMVEGTARGLRVEIPRDTFPKKAFAGARVERRVKSPRAGTAKFGALGEIAVPPSGPGPAGGVGPAAPIDDARIVVEFVPSGAPPSEPVPPPLVTLDAFRDTLPRRVLDLSPENDEGWNEVAKRAYAAALHGDPLVASLGVHTLAWLASGLSLQAVRIDKIAGGPEVAVVPSSVVDAIGDVGSRLAKTWGASGKLLPLGRNAIFRKALAARPWDDALRAKAAKDAVARLATVSPADLAPFLVPAILDGSAAPIDPPATPPSSPLPTIAPTVQEPTSATDAPEVRASRPRKSRGKRAVGFLGVVVVIAAIAWHLRSEA